MKLKHSIYRLSCLVGLMVVEGTLAFDHTHQNYATTLKRHVSDQGVDYSGLKEHKVELDRYLREISEVDEAEFNSWTREQQLALLLNLYNAATLDLVADHYPVKSIRKIGGFFGNPWKLEVVRLWGESHSLDWLEHEMIRPRYADARVHFALVCAAKGCPPLRQEPFMGDRLNEQLENQAMVFLAQSSKNRIDVSKRVLYLSPIFKWYRDDFVDGTKSLADYVRPYFRKENRAVLSDPGLEIEFTEYDWSLNDISKVK